MKDENPWSIIEGCGGQVFIWCKAGNICEMCGDTVATKKAMARYIIKQRAYDDLTQIKAREKKLEALVKAAKLINCHRQYSADKAWKILGDALDDLKESSQ